jgi:hypothetical protein
MVLWHSLPPSGISWVHPATSTYLGPLRSQSAALAIPGLLLQSWERRWERCITFTSQIKHKLVPRDAGPTYA